MQQMVDRLVGAGQGRRRRQVAGGGGAGDAVQGGTGQEGGALGVVRNDLATLPGVGDGPEEGFLRAGDGVVQLLGVSGSCLRVYVSSSAGTCDAPRYAATTLQSHAAGRVSRLAMALGNRPFAQDDAAGALPPTGVGFRGLG
ncbi:hypothetical protein [Streptomyces sp. JB150]|uniref:hypothetical protein n=1 Tax=Streptomyces sp. JB150 TaxID=2714844 RepID=UPI00140CEBD6|nr:hypothetical protein [Streptomyces sp. JB150]QIJ63461.1 hypothetical protein G7Z13_16540 [Streptomyces sp. JB150]